MVESGGGKDAMRPVFLSVARRMGDREGALRARRIVF